MAQTIVILCDECLVGGTEVPAQTYAVAIGLPGTRETPYAIDACTMHAEPFHALLKVLGEYGHRLDRKAPMPRVSTAGAPVGAPGPSSAKGGANGFVCPICGHTTPKMGGMNSHVKSEHGQTWAEATGQAGLSCPVEDCDRRFGAAQGLSAHLRTGHGMPVEEARAATAAAGVHE